MNDPIFLTALATLVTAVASLVKVLTVERVTRDHTVTLNTVQVNTNGRLDALTQQVASLQSLAATPKEIAARPEVAP
jgi:5-hydroxyisourate hydrolase-like protein (transthyretin family)